MARLRCEWAGNDPLYIKYHDEEWGVPVHDERKLFEFLILEGSQAGLSWITILKKRENYRRAFDRFDPGKVGRYGQARIRRLLADPGIVRNRAKVEAAVTNAQSFQAVAREFGSFDKFIWSFTAGRTICNRWRSLAQLPAQTPEAEAMSRDLKKRGFKFVGPKICYAFMQATGMVNDHVFGCFRHQELSQGVKR